MIEKYTLRVEHPSKIKKKIEKNIIRSSDAEFTEEE